LFYKKRKKDIEMLPDTEDVALSFEQTNLNSNSTLVTEKIRHPIAIVFHLLFRSLAIILYCVASSSSFIVYFVSITIFLSMDFWTVKNITGRLLVGLRWWNYVDEEGKSNWIFENRKNNQTDNNNSFNKTIVESKSELTIFWSSLIVTDLIWIIFFISSMFQLKWIVSCFLYLFFISYQLFLLIYKLLLLFSRQL
jgi:hypothetical protein